MRPRKLRIALLFLLSLAVVIGLPAWFFLLREVPIYFKSDLEHFKYGSVGVEAANGLPYWVWVVLPRLFPYNLPHSLPVGQAGPADYADFGFIVEEDHDAPIGMPIMVVGFRRIGINCALCHTATARVNAAAKPKILIGAPSSRIDLQAYLRFLFNSASDPRFTADTILPAIDAVHELASIERLLYRYLIIPQTRQALLEQKWQLAWMDTVTDWGPGRQDPFNPAKVQLLKRPYDGTIGNADIPPLWNWLPRRKFALHWDGLNTSSTEIFLNSGIGNGASRKTINIESLERIERWIDDLPPAKFPFPVNQERATQGEWIFNDHCASCHAFGGERIGVPIPIRWLGTDRHRLDSWTREAKKAFSELDEYDWKYEHFRKTAGYVAVSLDGIWARAPYLHNGSVPTLSHLLGLEDRPVAFYRGYDVYDPERVGFVFDGTEARRVGTRYDTTEPGNGNKGHDFGTNLSKDDKKALIEYLKTL